jgi:hypothetical protein
MPGIVSTWLGRKMPVARKRRWTTMAPTTMVMKVVQMRKASLYLRDVVDENSKMKL